MGQRDRWGHLDRRLVAAVLVLRELRTYNATYGSLGAMIGFMVWIWLSTIVILVGGEINAEMEHQTASDTTEGQGKSTGARSARMADETLPARA